MFKERFKISFILSVIIIILVIIASMGGLFWEDLYQDNDLVKRAWHGNDIVTLFIAVPMMIGALLFSIRGSQKAQLIWMGTLWYMVYNYIFYLYGSTFNSFFLLYVALFTFSTYALIFALIKTDVIGISTSFNSRTPVKWISGFMMFFAVFLGGVWIALSLSFVFTGQIPEAILQTEHPTGVVFATDISLLISSLAISAILLWKRNPWGYVLSSIVLIKANTYGLVLIVMSLISYIQTGVGDSMTPLWAVLWIGCLISLGFLFRNMKSIYKEV